MPTAAAVLPGKAALAVARVDGVLRNKCGQSLPLPGGASTSSGSRKAGPSPRRRGESR